ncbi:MAG: wax ester/triacylglycerol synthase family O-acyltransferase [Hyphomicrobiales bacterium]|nr:wax ester/triacylglycerol synthase family O-acyltransferase [Hyphomicrobiales bacterium]
MNRLSALDALFLYLETPETPMHVGSVTVFQPEKPQDDLFARFREHTAARLDLLPSYRRRLQATPLGIDHPAWLVEDKLDLDHHIRHKALPKPGSMTELRALVAELHALPLDRARPLWQYHFIEGLEGGAFAVYAKVHHAAMDGVAGQATLGVVYDFSPDDEHLATVRSPVSPDVEPSDAIELASTAVGDFIRQGWRAVKSLPGAAAALTRIAPNLSRDARFLFSYVKDTPRTPFNATISAARVYATCSLPLADVKALARSRGVTINDIVLALSAGGLRRYLIGRAALPKKPLTAAVPASVRAIGDAKLNNQVFFSLCRLPTDVAAPLPRLVAAQAAAQEAKSLFADVRNLMTTEISLPGAPIVVTALGRIWAGARAANYLWPAYNVIVSNVPGPPRPLYCIGAPATHYFPVSIPHHGCALNITVQSYCDSLDFGMVASRDIAPDAQRIADFIVEDFAALSKADAALVRPEAVETIAVAPRSLTVVAHPPIALLGEPLATAPAAPEKQEEERVSALSRDLDALGAAAEALMRNLEMDQASDTAAARAVPARTRVRRRKTAASGARRRKGKAPARSGA